MRQFDCFFFPVQEYTSGKTGWCNMTDAGAVRHRVDWGFRPSHGVSEVILTSVEPAVVWAILLVFSWLSCTAQAQVNNGLQGNFDGSAGGQLNYNSGAAFWSGTTSPIDPRFNLDLLNREANGYFSALEDPRLSVSTLDLKAPGKARREYDRGMFLLNRKDFSNAAEHMEQAVALYPKYVAAHNALGNSYLSMGKNEQARDEFAKAATLDDHLPVSHLNLGCAEFALKNYSAAETAIRRAAAIVPIDQQVLTALAYAELMNKNYAGTVETARRVHSRVHKGAAMVHFYAAAAWNSQQNSTQAQQELVTFLKEDPKSPAADDAKGLLEQLKQGPVPEAPLTSLAFSTSTENVQLEKPAGPVEVPWTVRVHMQDLKEQHEIAEAEAACEGCDKAPDGEAEALARELGQAPRSIEGSDETGWTLHSDVDEVSVFFAATDRGKAVGDLKLGDVVIRDANRAPVAISGFHSEADLPLRLGLVIDTSQSITDRFKFEQAAAADFVRKVVTGKDDLAFLVGFANSVLLVQDFTADDQEIAGGIGKLAPGGGTALWDAVGFAAAKLAERRETKPVARVLVVITDGEDNSSSESLKQAIETAEREEVTVYAVSTHDARDLTTSFKTEDIALGDRALRLLADRTGGDAFFPGSVSYLDRSLNQLQQVIRSRYLISYKPALFKLDGEYRPIEIRAQKAGHKLRVSARKGYYAQAATAPEGEDQQD
jgi:Ca-activated chloride channel homolog